MDLLAWMSWYVAFVFSMLGVWKFIELVQ